MGVGVGVGGGVGVGVLEAVPSDEGELEGVLEGVGVLEGELVGEGVSELVGVLLAVPAAAEGVVLGVWVGVPVGVFEGVAEAEGGEMLQKKLAEQFEEPHGCKEQPMGKGGGTVPPATGSTFWQAASEYFWDSVTSEALQVTLPYRTAPVVGEMSKGRHVFTISE